MTAQARHRCLDRPPAAEPGVCLMRPAGPYHVGSHDLAGRVAVLQHVEATFDPLPYDQGAARLYGQSCAAVRASGREPRKRASDLMIAATAPSNQLPLYTANPDDFKGAEGLVEVVAVQGRSNNL